MRRLRGHEGGGKKGPLNSSRSEMKSEAHTNTRPTKGGGARNRQETGDFKSACEQEVKSRRTRTFGTDAGPTQSVHVREMRQVRFVLLQVVQAVDVLDVHLKLPEVFGEDAWTWM